MCWHCRDQSVTGELYDDAWEEAHARYLAGYRLQLTREEVWDKRQGQYRPVVTVELPAEEGNT